ncbi:MAG: tyrosine--tRNA ligase [bacterium]|nr:tyrosine--tRNA ligase [bacterium]
MDKIDQLLTRGVEKIYPSKEALEKVLRSGKKLRLYNGIDPSAPHLHLGHAIVLRKLRQFQDLGHHIILLIGDFTGMIGDPTDKMATRRKMTHQQVLENAKTYKEQASKLLQFNGGNPAGIKFNSHWLAKLNFAELIELASNLTVQQLLERDMFQARIKKGKEVYLHEFLYPMMQGYDSVVMDVDLEVGGRDQTFNMLVGRNLMRSLKGKEKFVLTTPLLEDSEGKKIGKTEGNMIELNASPDEMFGKIMAISDNLIIPYFILLTDITDEEIVQMEEILKSGSGNPMNLKKKLAREIVTMYHSANDARLAEEEFERVVQKKELPAEIDTVSLPKIFISGATITDMLVETGLTTSRAEAKRLISQGGTAVDDKIITDPNAPFTGESGTVIRAGKRKFAKIKIG